MLHPNGTELMRDISPVSTKDIKRIESTNIFNFRLNAHRDEKIVKVFLLDSVVRFSFQHVKR